MVDTSRVRLFDRRGECTGRSRQPHGCAVAVRAGRLSGGVLVHRAVRPVWDQSHDGVRDPREVCAGRSRKPGGRLALAAHLPACDAGGAGPGDLGITAALYLGSAEGPGVAETPRPDPVPPEYCDRASHPGAVWPGPPAAAEPPARPSRSSHGPDGSAECGVECRLQGSVPDGQWGLLLSADRPGWGQSLSARVSGMLEPTIGGSRPVFEGLFRRYGLPDRLRTDNGAPFASSALGRLSTLSVWWVRLGILPDLIEPARPQQNGRHERMHKTL